MAMTSFDAIFPEVAEREIRTVVVADHPILPERPFTLKELYCPEEGCSCRRVLVRAIDAETGIAAATISYGFEPPAPPFEDEEQVFLDPLHRQSDYADALLEIFEGLVAEDDGYRDGLVHHYEMWKAVIDDPTDPAGAEIRVGPLGAEDWLIGKPFRRTEPKVGRNHPCPCASGRKFKACCGL